MSFPVHGDVLANLVRWSAKDSIPLLVQGAGLLGCELYQQGSRLILHVLNFTSAGTWRSPMHEFIAVGPIRMQVKLPAAFAASPVKSVRTMVSNQTLPVAVNNGWVNLELKSILDHELVVIES